MDDALIELGHFTEQKQPERIAGFQDDRRYARAKESTSGGQLVYANDETIFVISMGA